MSHGRTAYWMGQPAMLTVAAAVVAATALVAQAPAGIEEIYVLRGAQRDAKAEALMLADSAGGARAIRVYRVPASIEQVFRLYVKRMHAILDGDPDSGYALVIPPAPVTGSSPILYHLVYHAFEDECMDAAPAAGTACRKWRRGKDKKNVLADNRIGYEQGEYAKWVEVGTFTWLRREPDGDLVRLRIEIRDIGMSPDWKRHIPLAQLLLESVVVPPNAP